MIDRADIKDSVLAILALFALGLIVLAVMSAQTASAQLVGLPPTPILTEAGRALIFDGETSGRMWYNRDPHPEWPKGQSGITWGIGYDATAQSANLIVQDWGLLGATTARRLSAMHPYRGQAAQDRLPAVRDILVPWDAASDVFLRVDLARVDTQCRRSFPNFDALRPHAKDAVRSLVFNRGAAMNGPGRAQMRDCRDCLLVMDYAGAARADLAMIPLWRGRDIYAGMRNRRQAEAKLFQIP